MLHLTKACHIKAYLYRFSADTLRQGSESIDHFVDCARARLSMPAVVIQCIKFIIKYVHVIE